MGPCVRRDLMGFGVHTSQDFVPAVEGVVDCAFAVDAGDEEGRFEVVL